MTDDGEPAGTAASHPDDATPLGRYARRMRRARAVYAAVVGLIVVALGIGVAVAWAHGETAHVTLHTVAKAPPSLAIAPPSTTLQQAWRTSDRAAIGDPVFGGTLVTWSQHTVRGRDVRTGRQTWSYTRTDRSVCAAMQLVGTTVAIYEKDGNCDEVTGLSTATGQRTWTRTLDEDGRPINGSPTYIAYTASSVPTAVIRTASVIYAIDPGSGEDRWSWYHYGCTIRGMVMGSAGALISQDCSRAQQCNSHKFCGPGVQLLLRDGTAGYDTDNYPNNPDRIIWNRFGDSSLPVSADSLISALPSGSAKLRTYDATKGTPLGGVSLHPAPSGAPRAAVETSPGEVVTIGATTYAIVNGAVRWSLATAEPPTVISTDIDVVPALNPARITVAGSAGIETISGRTGAVSHTFAVPVPSGGAIAEPLGTGFVVSAPSGTIAYR